MSDELLYDYQNYSVFQQRVLVEVRYDQFILRNHQIYMHVSTIKFDNTGCEQQILNRIIAMTETTVVSHLFALGIISMILNSFLLFPLAGLNLAGAILYGIIIGLERVFIIIAIVIHIGFIFFSIGFAVVTLIGSALGFMYQDNVRKIGLKLLIATNTVLFVFLMANMAVLIAGIIVASRVSVLLYIPAAAALFICLCQCGLFGYGSFYIAVICNSFNWKSDDREPA